jgi:hypothetical protein
LDRPGLVEGSNGAQNLPELVARPAPGYASKLLDVRFQGVAFGPERVHSIQDIRTFDLAE